MVGAITFALTIGLSRAWIGVHWPSDVLAGWLMGGVVVAVVAAFLPPGGEKRSTAAADVGPWIRVVLFDWGDTLMVDDGQAGRMVDWPRVAALPGAAETLAALHGRFRLCVATNADDSGADKVMAALGRAGLARFIDRVFSSRDLGVRKPDPTYFAAVLDALRADAAERGEPPLSAEEVVMVGDSYENDVAGAMAAGLRAVWFNPTRVAPSSPRNGLAPDAEIDALGALRDVMRALRS
jgi:putative hydrolase of the HAD superfamily